MFEHLQMAPPDAILGLGEAFRKDPRAEKINLSVGVYKDASGKTPVLNCVKEAEKRMLAGQATKSYLDIEGLAEYDNDVRDMLFGANHPIVTDRRSITAQTPGGTGALRLAADFLRLSHPHATVWVSKPTWPNHPSVFQAAGLKVESYPYFDAAKNALAFDALLEAIGKIPERDVILLHGCCHNPSGIDPTNDQWKQIAEVVARRKLLPLVDFAYQGFGSGLVEDASGLATLAQSGGEMLVCSSFSKNFGLYNERVGALTAVAVSAEQAPVVLSQIKVCARVNYSNPPAHGAQVVATVLGDAALRKQWEDELSTMRNRINGMRSLFARTMKGKRPDRDFSFITQQRGMFSFSGLSPVQVDELRAKHAVYVVGNGRINVAGMTEDNMERLCESIAAVL